MRHLRLGDALGTTLKTVAGHPTAFIATQGAVLGGLLVVAAFLYLTLGLATVAFAAGGNNGAAMIAGIVFLLTLMPLFIGYATACGMGIHAADAALRGERIGFAKAWSLTRPRLGNLATTLLVRTLLLLMVLLLGVLVTLPFADNVEMGLAAFIAVYALAGWLAARWAVALPLSALESHGPRENLRASARLTRGSRGTLVGAYVVLYVAAYALPLIAMAGAGFPLGTANSIPSLVGAFAVLGVVMLVVALAFTFLLTTLTVVAYRRLQPAPAANSVAPGGDGTSVAL